MTLKGTFVLPASFYFRFIDVTDNGPDVKGRASTHRIPYKLVSTPGQLRSLVPGRRKAIEVSNYLVNGENKF